MPSLSLNAPPAPQASGEGPAQNAARARAANWWRSLWPGRNAKIDDIRRLMLAQLDVVPDPERRLALAEQIARATCLQSLWRLRSEVMAALVEVHGELLARQRMTDISFMFAGLLERDHRAEDPAPQ